MTPEQKATLEARIKEWARRYIVDNRIASMDYPTIDLCYKMAVDTPAITYNFNSSEYERMNTAINALALEDRCIIKINYIEQINKPWKLKEVGVSKSEWYRRLKTAQHRLRNKLIEN